MLFAWVGVRVREAVVTGACQSKEHVLSSRHAHVNELERRLMSVYRKESFSSKESDTMNLQSIYTVLRILIGINSYSNRISLLNSNRIFMSVVCAHCFCFVVHVHLPYRPKFGFLLVLFFSPQEICTNESRGCHDDKRGVSHAVVT